MGATRSGCSELSNADNEKIAESFECTDPTTQGAARDACVHCGYKVLKNNVTKKVRHIAVCEAFKKKCVGEEAGAHVLKGVRDRVVLACVKYTDKTKALMDASKFDFSMFISSARMFSNKYPNRLPNSLRCHRLEIVREVQSRQASASPTGADVGPSRTESSSIVRGPLAPWGKITRFMGDNNVCGRERKEAIEKQIMRMILRSGLPLSFAENKHFQDLVTLLNPAYAKTCNPFPGKK